ncbi:hypothetical protein B4U78_013935 [Microbacterium esteraromaticum]|nr:hypothetical protein B4U78_013935 [Microbacterium esteraromaticum]
MRGNRHAAEHGPARPRGLRAPSRLWRLHRRGSRGSRSTVAAGRNGRKAAGRRSREGLIHSNPNSTIRVTRN